MDEIILYISTIILSLYTLLGVWVLLGFYVPVRKKNTYIAPRKISLIIVFRNEEKNLPLLLASLKKLQYPTEEYECIFVDDHSTDKGKNLVEGSGLKNGRVISLANTQGKKAGLALGIQHASGEMMVVTDADCVVPADWLQEINAYEGVAMIPGPVALRSGNRFLHIFQEVEWAALQSLTAAAGFWKMPLMNNGANLAYIKKEYREEGLKNITPSGDDIFMLEDFQKRKLPIVYGWDEKHMVITTPVNTLKELVNQKVRWASKSKYSVNTPNKIIGYIVFLINFLLLMNAVLSLVGILSLSFFMMFYVAKIIADMMMMLPYTLLVKKPVLLLFSAVTGLMYPFYFLWIFVAAVQGNYSWKGRSHHA